ELLECRLPEPHHAGASAGHSVARPRRRLHHRSAHHPARRRFLLSRSFMDSSAPSAALRSKLPLPLLSAVAALPPLAVDMYLPAFQLVADDLGTGISQIQLSLSLFLLG